jgi:hypothetical protein
MAYSTTNPPRLMIPAMGGPLAANSTSVAAGGAVWYYNTADPTSQICTPGYFTNGLQLGFRHGDVVMGVSRASETLTASITFLGNLRTSNSTAGWNLTTDGMFTSSFT